MATQLQVKTFDYSEFDSQTRQRLIRHAADIAKAKGDVASGMLRIGESVSAANGELAAAGREGRFTAWVEAECNFTRQSAYNYMNAWEAFGEVNCKTVLQLDDSAMYLLAAPATPKAAVKEALKIADKGQHVTKKLAQALIEKHTPQPESEPDDEEAGEDEAPQEGTPNSGGAVEPQETEAAPVSIPEDSAGQPIPKALREVFDRSKEFDAHARTLTAIQQWAEKIGAELPGKWLHVQSFKADLNNAKQALRHNKPYAVCPYCQAKKPKCEACKGVGFVSKRIYDGAPQELRA